MVAKNGDGFFAKLKQGLTKTKEGFINKVESLLMGRKKIDEELFDDLEELLIQGDVGVQTATELIEWLKSKVKEDKIHEPEAIKDLLKERISEILTLNNDVPVVSAKPSVVMVVGVNGVGKTTTCGKLGNIFTRQGKKVLFAAADTFRAAAIDQLEIWARRVGADIIKHQEGSDPAAVAFDAFQAAKARDADVLLIDTAGRLHNKANLMRELEKVGRVIKREDATAPHQVLLVLDATTGQNAISQAKTFKEVVDVTGIVLTKLDGTAKGGVIVGICNELNIPVTFIGIGEGIDDLRPFDGKAYVEALFS